MFLKIPKSADHYRYQESTGTTALTRAGSWAGFNIGATSVEAGTGLGQLPAPGSYSPVASKMGLTGQSQD